MKCTNCGNINLVKTYFPLSGDASLSYEIDVYFCVECGHYEFFSPAKIEKYKNMLAWIRNRELEIEQLNKELEEMQNPLIFQNIQDEINMLETQLKNLDITVRQQQEFTSRVSELKRELQLLPNKIKLKKETISRLQSGLESNKRQFENGSFDTIY